MTETLLCSWVSFSHVDSSLSHISCGCTFVCMCMLCGHIKERGIIWFSHSSRRISDNILTTLILKLNDNHLTQKKIRVIFLHSEHLLQTNKYLLNIVYVTACPCFCRMVFPEYSCWVLSFQACSPRWLCQYYWSTQLWLHNPREDHLQCLWLGLHWT